MSIVLNIVVALETMVFMLLLNNGVPPEDLLVKLEAVLLVPVTILAILLFIDYRSLPSSAFRLKILMWLFVIFVTLMISIPIAIFFSYLAWLFIFMIIINIFIWISNTK